MKALKLMSFSLAILILVPNVTKARKRGLLGGLFKRKKMHESHSYHHRMEQEEYARHNSMNRFMKKPSTMTLSEEKELGQRLVAKFMHLHGVKLKSFKTHGDIWDYCNVLCSSLLPKMPQLAGRTWSVGILASEKPLIFSAPGGYILLSIGLLRQLENEAELAGLLAYEMAAICRRHHLYIIYKSMVKHQNKRAFLSILAAPKTKQTTGSKMLSNMFKQARDNQADADHAILAGGFSPVQVYEADMLAIRALAYQGYSPRAYVRVLNKLFGKEKLKQLSPPKEKRLTRVLAQIQRCFPWHKELALGKERYLNEVVEKLD